VRGSHGPERPPSVGRDLLVRFALGGLLIVLLAATATATAGLLTIKGLADKLRHVPGGHIGGDQITRAQAGDPQTILVLGSDRRYSDYKGNNPRLTRSNPGRSDTIMLIRLDPDQEATAVMSIPRDLKVLIPGHGTDKINAAYAIGGPELTLLTLKGLLGIEINHVVNVNFSGFREAVNALGCVYADVDHHYYHSNAGLPPSAQYAEIDVDPGYQRLCGQKALDYVRFRHNDNDLVRGARQQGFLRAAKDQISTSQLFNNRGALVDIFANATQTDSDLATLTGLERLLKLGLFSAGHPVTEIKFPGQFGGDSRSQFVTASPYAVARTVQRFLHATPANRRHSGARGRHHKRARTDVHALFAALSNSRRDGEDLVAPLVAHERVPFDVYFPARTTPGSRYTTVDPNPRAYTLRDRAGRRHHAYRLVLVQSEIQGQYYGVQGTDWRTPPILSRPTSTRAVRGRRLLLYRDGDRLRLVAWRTKRAAYWIANSLSSQLTNAQMIGVAASLTRFEAK
jgi:LCP family protein required for cell wall assembly